LTSGRFRPLFPDCTACNRASYSEPAHYRRHIHQKHDFSSLTQKAFERGILNDPFYFHSKSFIVNQLVESCRIERP